MCTEIIGLPYVALSFDGGKTLVESREPRVTGTALTALIALDVPDALLAAVAGDLFASSDAGCHWRAVGKTHSIFFAEGRGGVAYGWGVRNGFEALTLHGVEPLPEPPRSGWQGRPVAEDITALAGDARDPRHLRLLTLEGQVFDSTDQGRSWMLHAQVEAGKRLNYGAAIAPDDIDQLVGVTGKIHSTRDGGLTWRLSDFGQQETQLVAPPIAAGGNLVWAITRQHVYRSTDGGMIFSAVASWAETNPPAEHPWIGGSGDPTELHVDSVVRRQPASGPLLLLVRNALLRFDGSDVSASTQPIRLASPGVATAATLIPGRPSMLCFAVATPSPPLPEGWKSER